MRKPYEYYNDAEDGENNGVYIYRLIDGEWRYWNRIAPHGMANIFRDTHVYIDGKRERTFMFIPEWGRGERVYMVNGQRTAFHPSLDKPLVG